VGRLLNDFFGSVFTSENCSNIPEAKNRVLDGSMNALPDIDITPELVASHIRGFKQIKAAGGGREDGLSSSFLKKVEGVIIKPLFVSF